MALTNSKLEQLCQWCMRCDTLADTRAAAMREFFGDDEPKEVRYIEGAGDITSRQRRFMGWFCLTFKLKDGRHPAELAAEDLLEGAELDAAVDAIRNTRFVLAVVAMVMPGKGLILKLEDEEFSLDNRQLSRLFEREDALCAHIIPVGRHGWLVGPGWLEWLARLGPGMQASLKKFQLNPVELERFLQQRKDLSKDQPGTELPRDFSLKAAVARMTEEAKAKGRKDLIMTPAQWQKLVIPYITSGQINAFSQDIVHRVGKTGSIEELNKWLGLAINIWNNTPQPDRGGKSSFEISQEYDTQYGS